MSATVKVMSFNIRCRVPADGNNFQDLRREKMLATIRREQPDLIGFQEVQEISYAWLQEVLPEYVFLGHGRDAGYRGEFAPLAYRKDRFYLHAFREKWLSFRDSDPASRLEGLDQSNCPRVYCCAELIHKDCQTPFAFFNIHTDHKGPTARTVECAQMLLDANRCGLPYVMTGDFNAQPEEDCIRMILAAGAKDLCAESGGTFHGFGRLSTPTKIDYIFTNMDGNTAEAYAVADDDSCGCYYSDHNAVCAYVELK